MGIEREVEPAEAAAPVSGQAAAEPPAWGGPGATLSDPRQVFALQRAAGNQAVHALLQRQQTAVKPPARPRASGSIVFTPTEAMTPHEFAVRAEMLFFGIGRRQAEEQVAVKEARTPNGRAGTGPHYENGVAAEEVGKPFRVGFEGGGMGKEEQASTKAITAEVAGLPAAERNAINAEADRRFWKKAGVKPGTKLGTGAAQAADRDLWLRTRNEVVRQRAEVKALPERIREFVAPGGAEIAPEDYPAVLRIAEKLETFSEEDWALYERRVNAQTSDYARIEASINRFLARQASEQEVLDRVKGTESLYAQVKAFEDLQRRMFTPPLKSDRLPIDQPGNKARYEAEKESLENAVKAARFDDVADYKAACAAYLSVFRARAVELTMLALRASEEVVTSELKRYGDPAASTDLYTRLAAMRRLQTESSAAFRRAMPTPVQLKTESITPTPAQQQATQEYIEKGKLAEAERQAQAGTNPILKDPELRTQRLNVASAAELAEVLRENAQDRLSDISKTRAKVLVDPEFVFKLDRIVAMTLQELGAGTGSIGELIVKDHQQLIKAREFAIGIALAALAIGLGLLTFGGGTVAVLAAGAGLTLSIYSAGEEWDKYDKASAAAHTAFDADKTVSSEDPTIFWLALSLVAIGLDGAALVKALRAAAPAAKVLAETGSAAKFEETLAKATELSEGVKNALGKRAKAEEDFAKAAEDLSHYTKTKLYSGLDPVYLAKVTKSAYYAAAEGIRDFQLFLAKLKLQKFAKGLELEKLTAAELEALENAFKAGVKEFEAATPTFSVEVRYASGPSKLTIGPKGELVLDGKVVGAGAEHAEVVQKLGLAHAYKGHGAKRDVLTIANEALQNAAKPKGAGLSSVFASDEAMLRSLEAAKAEVAAGKGVKSGAYTLVDLPTTPSTGRIFVAKAKLPAGVTPLNPTPFAALPDVAELPVTHVRALFTEVRPGVFEIADLFPAFK